MQHTFKNPSFFTHKKTPVDLEKTMEDKHLHNSTQQPQRPTITLPPRPSYDTIFGSAASPGPLSLVSSLFADNYADTYGSFSQLLAGAMASSPLAQTSMHDSEKSGGFKQSRPAALSVAARSPLFTVPPGMSPSGLLGSPGLFSPQGPFGMSHQQALEEVTAQAAFVQYHMQNQADHQPSSVMVPSEQIFCHTSFSSMPNVTAQGHMLSLTSDANGPPVKLPETCHSNRKPQRPPMVLDKPADDGYNWRKYGQKPIKGSEFPRSYYKCTHVNCPVKKKVERSFDGQITEIIYKGQHNHEMSQSSRRSKDNSDPVSRPEAGLQCQNGNLNYTGDMLPSGDQESTQTNSLQLIGCSDSEEVDEAETKVERDNDEPYPKRRIIEAGASEVVSSHKTVTEPRIVLQTRSEVDLLDDGYRWRKYGQKVVKGNCNPRSYYKCTYMGCHVRKQVERAPADPKAVITTYEGKHNHDVPSARNSSHNTVNSNASHQVVTEKHSLPKGMKFGGSGQRPIVLQLKEEQITA